VTIAEKPGSFLAFCKLLGKRSITEFNYRYFDSASAHIFVGISSSSELTDKTKIIHLLEKKGCAVTDMTLNELAKEHIRYMVGGQALSELNSHKLKTGQNRGLGCRLFGNPTIYSPTYIPENVGLACCADA